MRGEARSYAAARKERAADTDRWLKDLFRTASDGEQVSLVAVGSLGRGELAPGSDLDLVLLHDGRPDVARIADRIWYPIWDSAVGLDHAVRTVDEAVTVARQDLKAVLSLIQARHLAGDPELTRKVRESVLAEWRADSRRRLSELREAADQRAQTSGELAFLLEPHLKDGRGGLRDVQAMQAVAAAWVAPAPGPRAREAYDFILDVRHALHVVTARGADRLVLQEQDAVAGLLGLLDAEALMRRLAEAGRTISHAFDTTWRSVDRLVSGPAPRGRRPLADGVVEHGGEVVLARGISPRDDPVLVLRAAAAAAESGLPLAPATVSVLAAQSPAMPVPWPVEARDALVSILGAGHAAVPVWEELDQAGIVVKLLPDWERVRHRPQRHPIHRFTVDRHLIETAIEAAAHTRRVARPDLLLVAALLHDIGKGWPGDHSVSGEVIAREAAARIGFGKDDVDVLGTLVRHHLTLVDTATRRDLDDPTTVATFAEAVGGVETLELLHALTEADAAATGPAAWSDWRDALVRDLVARTRAEFVGRPVTTDTDRPVLPDVTGELPVVRLEPLPYGAEVTIAAPDRVGLLALAAGVLALHRLTVRSAAIDVVDGLGVTVWTVETEFGRLPDPAALREDVRKALAGNLDVAARLAKREAAYTPRRGITRAPARVEVIPDASATATVLEVRAHDSPGLLHRIGKALADARVSVLQARVGTHGAEAVDAFYVVDPDGRPLGRPEARGLARVLEKALA